MSVSAWKTILLATGAVLGVVGFVYADSFKSQWFSQDKADIARIVLPPAVPVEAGAAKFEVNELAAREAMDRNGAALPRVAPSPSFVPIVNVARDPRDKRVTDAKIAVLQVGAQLRSGPGFDRPRIMVVKGGLKIQILNTQGEWVHVKFPSGRRGFVHSSLVDES